MNDKVAALVSNPSCTECKLNQYVDGDEVCITGYGPSKAPIMVVSKMDNSGNYRNMIETELIQAGLDIGKIYFASALKCRTFDANASNLDVKKCRPYLEAEIAIVKPKWILAFGNEALLSTTGHSGIMNYRGRVIAHSTYSVVPTISPAAVVRSPMQKQGWEADIQFFASQVLGRPARVGLPKIAIIDKRAKLLKLFELMDSAELLSYDVETTSDADPWDDQGAIISLAGTMLHTMKDTGEQKLLTWALPLHHPQSVWKSSWRKVVKLLGKHWDIPRQVAHNGKFDAKWLREFGCPAKVTFDTILAAHLLDENRLKGLKPLARILLGVPDWSVNTKDLYSTPIMDVLKYNALDTYYTYKLYELFKEELLKQPRLLRIFMKLVIPANEDLTETERRGIWVDREKLASATKVAFDMRGEIDRQLLEFVPDPELPGHSIHAESDSAWPTNARGRQVEVNFNPSNFARWFLFDHLGLPVLERGKDKPNGSPGDPSMKEAVMLELKKTKHPAIELLLERAKWQKYCSTYVTRYQELMDENDRIHTIFKLAGTVTGRLSSGKEDAEKITAGAKTNRRGVNLQQVPRDPFIRSLFGASEGWTFIEADFSQVELRVVAFLSRDRNMMHLYQTGQDIHLATASWVMGIPKQAVTKDDRKKAKAVNFGFVYGMYEKKFVATAFEKYELIFSMDEAKGIRKTFFERFPGLPAWHERQRRIVRQFGRVQSPIGRIRHLPDIYSSDINVVREAERQAINSPVQSFASDMNTLSMILLNKEFRRRGLEAYVLGAVHDALNIECRNDHVAQALPLIKKVMENLPLKRMFGVDVDVPIIVDISAGKRWSEGTEIPQEIFNARTKNNGKASSLQMWLQEENILG